MPFAVRTAARHRDDLTAARHRDDLTAALWSTAEGFGDVDATCAITGGIMSAPTGVAGAPQWLRRREALPGG